MYLLFKEAELLQSREELWEVRKHEILALPDPLASLPAEQRQGFDNIRKEVETLFKKYVKCGQIVFRAMPAGNEHMLQGFTTHFVVDSNMVCSTEDVHQRLAALLDSDTACQQPCQCRRSLLISSMTDALSRQKDGPSKERILHDVMGEYMLVTRYEMNLPASSSTVLVLLPAVQAVQRFLQLQTPFALLLLLPLPFLPAFPIQSVLPTGRQSQLVTHQSLT